MVENTKGKININKKQIVIISISAVLIALLSLGLGYYQRTKNSSNPDKSSNTAASQTAIANIPVDNSNTPNSSNADNSNTINSSTGSGNSVSKKAGDSSKVIIYNTHPWDKYKFGNSITDISGEFSEKLNQEGIQSTFLENKHAVSKDSYKFSHDLVLDNVADSKNKVLLDILTGENTPKTDAEILIWVCKGNKDYLKNKNFADTLAKEVKTLDKNIPIQVFENKWIWNQDLSDMALTIVIGNKTPTKAKIDRYIDVLSSALKSIQS